MSGRSARRLGPEASALSAAQAASAPPWDLVVIGGGTAGLVASRAAGGFGARVLLIERERYGGECLWTGCVPSKALLASAHAAHDARSSAALGVMASVTVDFSRVMDHVRASIDQIRPADDPAAAHAEGVHTVDGSARFVGRRELVVAGHRVRFRSAVIATGGTAVIPDIPGIENVDVLTSETFWSLDTVPARLLVIGGGAAGCELSQAMVRLGSAVTMLHRGSRLAARGSRRASALLHATLEADGVDVRTGTSVEQFTSAIRARLSDGSSVEFDRVLVAVGKRPATAGLGLEEAGVTTDERGRVVVDPSLRTSNPAIWAAGDVTPMPHFTHVAGVFGSLAGTNAVLGLGRRIDGANVPRVLYTQPEFASVGLSPDDAAAQGCTVLAIDHEHLDRAVAEGRTIGFTELVVDERGRLRGASVASPRAGETIDELTVAITTGVSASTLGGIMHAYPGYSDGVYNASIRQLQREFSRGAAGTAVQVLRRVKKARYRVLERLRGAEDAQRRG